MSEKKFKKIFDKFENYLSSTIRDEAIRNKILNNLMLLRQQKVNILIVGATGSGKSTTINALFGLDLEVQDDSNPEFAKVGHTPNPETMEIQKYELDNLILWDSPGLGDGLEKDVIHSKKIQELLNKKDKKGNALIDLVLVIVDSSSRDLGTTYDLINEVIIPNIKDIERIVVALNKCDVALTRTRKKPEPVWLYDENKPSSRLEDYLNNQVIPVFKDRIYNTTEVMIEPIFYSAEYNYNISKLLYLIIINTPDKKRLIYAEKINEDDKVFSADDKKKNYKEEIRSALEQSIVSGLTNGVDMGGDLGGDLGEWVGGNTGRKIGQVVGKITGGAVGLSVGAVKGVYREIKKFLPW